MLLQGGRRPGAMQSAFEGKQDLRTVVLFCLGLITAAFGLTSLALADREAFCAGFVEGYKTVKGNLALVPLCPIEPITPIGSTPFREGIKAGIAAAMR